MCALSGVLAIALPVPVIVSNFEYYYKEELARQVAEQAKESARENRARAENHLHLPPTLASSDLDIEILELKGICPKSKDKSGDLRNSYSKIPTPNTTPGTPRRRPETVL